MEPSPYPQLPDTGSSLTPHNAYSTPATSPPTPVQTDGIMTRSGRSLARAHGDASVLGPQASRIEKSSPKPSRSGAGARKNKKRRGKGLGDEPAVVLEAPLSVLVKDITTVKDTNIEEYVNRSPAERQAEVQNSKEGKVKRPMNAFMLYRKAYQNRTKEWKKYDNHQIISQLCGTSWNMEGQELRDQYDTWAKIERANHKLAFPDYKFAPAKAKNKKVPPAGRGAGPNSEEDGSDLEGYDWDISVPPSRNGNRTARPLYDHPDAEYRPPGMRSAYAQYPPQPPPPPPSHHRHHQSPMMHNPRLGYPPPNQSSYHYPNPGKPRPAEYGTSLGQNQYYQQTNDYRSYPPAHMYGAPMQQSQQQYVDNMYVGRTNSPGGSYHSSPVDHYGDLIGSPYPTPQPQQPQVAMPHSRVLEHHSNHHPQPHPIDPSLMGPPPGANQFDTLGILQGLDQNDGGLGSYSLDQMPSLNGHGSGAGDSNSHAQSQSQQQFEQAFQQVSSEGGGVDVEPSWHDDPVMTKLDSDWETIAAGGEFNLDDIDGILGTTDSPGG